MYRPVELTHIFVKITNKNHLKFFQKTHKNLYFKDFFMSYSLRMVTIKKWRVI